MFGQVDNSQSLVTFANVNINVGQVWQSSLNAAVIPDDAAGTYFIHLEGGSTYANGFVLTLKVNGLDSFYVKHNIVNSYASQSRENSIIIRLNSADKLTVSQVGSLYSGSHQTAFNGFRLA